MKVYLQVLFLIMFLFTYVSAEEKFLFFPLKAPPPCPPFEMYKFCLSNCSNCEQRGNCIPSDCDEGGCDCMPHFVRLTPGGPCEPIGKCPAPECKENEVFRECGPVCEKCESLNCRVISCEHKCYCKEGFKRNADGNCIPEDECPTRQCSLQEEQRDSGPEDEYCLHSDSEKGYGAIQNKTQCYCKPGFKRNTMGHCMDERFCSVIKCFRQEIYNPCPKKCNSTCRTYGDPKCVEDDECYPGCFCPEGYLMNDFRRCVKLEDCAPGSNPYVPTRPPQLETTPYEVTTPAGLPTPSDSDTVTDSDSDSSEKGKTTSSESFRTTASEDKVDDEEEEEGLQDEDVPETTKRPMITTPEPIRKPKSPRGGKSRNSKSDQHESASVKVSTKPKSKPKPDIYDDIEENM